MADSLLNTVKQGSQLFKESSEAVSSLSQKAGRPEAPTSPMETAVIGGTPSQSKMAGTPAALQGKAVAPRIATSLKLATQQRQQQADPELAADQKRALELSQKLSGLGSLGQRVPDLIQKAVEDKIKGINVKPVVDPTTFADLNLSGPNQASLTDALNVLADPSQSNEKQQEAMVTVSNLTKQDLSKLDPTTLSKTVQGFFKKGAAANLEAAVSTATPSSVTLGMLGETPSALGYNSWDALATDLGIKAPEGRTAQDVLKGMSIKELGQTVDTIKRTGFQTQQEWMSVLQDPTSSLQDRQVARTMLTNMGASGVREAEQRTATLTAQVQAGNTVTVNLTGTPQQMSVEEVLKNDTIKGAISVLLDPAKPGYKEVAAANPELLAWVQKNAEVLKDAVQGITDDVSQFATNNAANAQLLNQFFPDEKARNAIGNVLFPGTWGTFSAQKYNLATAPLLQNWAQIPAAEQTQISTAIQTIADGGTAEDIQAFLTTNRDALKNLKLDTAEGVKTFQNFWTEQKLIRSLSTKDISTAQNANSLYFDITGQSKEKMQQDADTQAALGPLGFKSSSGLTLSSDPTKVTGMVTGSVSMKDLLDPTKNKGQLPVSLKDRIAGVNKEMQDFAGTIADPALRALASATLQKRGKLSNQEVFELIRTGGFQDNLAAIQQIQKTTGVNLGSLVFNAAMKDFNTKLTANGLPGTLDRISHDAGMHPEKIQDYLNKLNSMRTSADASIFPDIDKAITDLTKRKKQEDTWAKQKADKEAADKAALEAANMQFARDLAPNKVTTENFEKGVTNIVKRGRW
jgi:hypothetical protein